MKEDILKNGSPVVSTESAPPNDLEFPVKTIDTLTQDILLQMVALEQSAWGRTTTTEELAEWLQGALVGAIYSGDQMIGNVITRTVANPESDQLVLKRLPPESWNGDGTAIHPHFRGKRLQKALLLSRIELARQSEKETIISTVRPENGASLRNIISTGARILAYSSDYYPKSDDPARLVWENDLIKPATAEEKIEKKDGEFPDIVIEVRSGEEVDIEAQKAISEILSKEYIGVAVQTLGKDKGVPTSSAIVFRHLSNFPPDVEKRLRERKKKIQEILKSTQEKLALRVEIVDSPTAEILNAIRELRVTAAKDKKEAFFLVTTLDREMEITNQERAQDYFGEGKFVLLIWSGSQPVGMVRGEEEEKGIWEVGAGYIIPERRNNLAIVWKLFFVLSEIKKRGGSEAIVGVKKLNTKMIRILERFGFKRYGETGPGEDRGWKMKLDLTDEVIKKINVILNAE
ncbi:MAG TPA: hypothetical protein VGO21_01190 [Candidatus Paceibacterota bacterium]|jgi:ribosomal protein S18 acetylase RimI-like enzyme|nr:hypothetical protein [Candidatus Paceibacterota bacterium]